MIVQASAAAINLGPSLKRCERLSLDFIHNESFLNWHYRYTLSIITNVINNIKLVVIRIWLKSFHYLQHCKVISINLMYSFFIVSVKWSCFEIRLILFFLSLFFIQVFLQITIMWFIESIRLLLFDHFLKANLLRGRLL